MIRGITFYPVGDAVALAGPPTDPTHWWRLTKIRRTSSKLDLLITGDLPEVVKSVPAWAALTGWTRIT
jgi:hypothetical protein